MEFCIHIPPDCKWRVEVMKDVYWMREEGEQPNAFHRFMQRIFFGFKWEKIK